MNRPAFNILLLMLLPLWGLAQGSMTPIEFKTEYLLNAEIEAKIAADESPYKHQFAAFDYATKGAYREALHQFDLAMRVQDRSYTEAEADSIRQRYRKVEAVSFISEQAKNHQIVIINEAHHSAFHRVFTKSLLQPLYDQGYRYLGLEALTNNAETISRLHEQQYPDFESGHYLKDPQFGNLVREALDIGFQLFPYDQSSAGKGKPREIEQANQILRFMNEHPDAKVLIHCGFDHVLEGHHRKWEKAMAGRLAEFSNMDPLTIHQVQYSEKSDPKYNSAFLKAMAVEQSSILLNPNDEPLAYRRREAYADLAILHPNTKYIDGRPHWLFEQGHQKVNIEFKEVAMDFPIMVLAYPKGEDILAAVPVDLTEVESEDQPCVLALKAGDYQIILTNGEQSWTMNHTVK